MARTVLVLALLAAGAPAQTLAIRIQAVINRTPETRRAQWGFRVVPVKGTQVLAQKNADMYFTPASNTKLYTTALALLRLGPDYRFQTTVETSSVAVDGEIRGDVRVVGTGDPTMSWRRYPYERGETNEIPLSAIEDLANQIAAKGIRRITGSIIGDDTRWPWEPYPAGWALDDSIWSYGAPVSALTINENTIQLRIRAAESEGQPAILSLVPALEYYWIDNRILTQAGRRQIDAERNGRLVRLTGHLPVGSAERTENLAIDDPAFFVAHALTEELTRRGIAIAGTPEVRHRLPGETYSPATGPIELARRQSRPLSEIAQVVNKVSQNLMAEILLRAVGSDIGEEGSAKQGIAELELLLSSIGVDHEDYDFRDGSGLSRLNLTTPATTIELLKHMYDSPLRDVWVASLPVGGLDGTLETRFEGKKRGNVVQAKTGTLTHVNALSGYIRSRTFGMVAFSIMVNGANTSAAIRTAIDKICLEIAR